LLEFAEENPKNGIWGGRTVFADGSLNPTSCWGPFTVWSEFCGSFGLRAMLPESLIFNPRSYGRWQRDSIREVGIVTGCFFLMRIEDWNALGGFDPEFFMYGEEADLCMRGICRGMRPIVTPNATIIHHGGASEPIQVDKMVRLHDANVRLFRRHFSKTSFSWVFLAMRLGIRIRGGVIALRDVLRLRSAENDWTLLWKRRAEWTKGVQDSRGDRV
jgi:GT2 family glycosyltransferase